MKKLGLDVSTNIIGVCIYDHEKNQSEFLDIINVSQFNEMIDKFLYIEEYFERFKLTHDDFNTIQIEEFKLGYMQSSIVTLTKLSAINYFVQYICKRIFNKTVCPVSESQARKKVYGKIVLNGKKKKDVIGELALQKYPDLVNEVYNLVKTSHPEMLVSRGSNKGELLSVYKECWKDVSDAITIARF